MVDLRPVYHNRLGVSTPGADLGRFCLGGPFHVRQKEQAFLKGPASRGSGWEKGKPPAPAGDFPFLIYTRFHTAPPGTSVISMPWAFSSSRMRSASAKFFDFLASARCNTSASTAGSPSP